MRILIVEDSPADAKLLKWALEEKLQNEAKFRDADRLETAIKYLEEGNIDCVLLDLHLPDSSGYETFTKLYTRFPDVPIVITSNTTDRDLALRLIRDGAAYFMQKPYKEPEELFRNILFAVEKHRNSLRVPVDAAEEGHRFNRLVAELENARKEGPESEVDRLSSDMLSSIGAISQSLFVEIQKVRADLLDRSREQREMARVVDELKTAVLEGRPDQLSMVARMGILEHQLQSRSVRLRSKTLIVILVIAAMLGLGLGLLFTQRPM